MRVDHCWLCYSTLNIYVTLRTGSRLIFLGPLLFQPYLIPERHCTLAIHNFKPPQAKAGIQLPKNNGHTLCESFSVLLSLSELYCNTTEYDTKHSNIIYGDLICVMLRNTSLKILFVYFSSILLLILQVLSYSSWVALLCVMKKLHSMRNMCAGLIFIIHQSFL